jgi:endonuclease/exonuclease/phosphatase family metal-dependent hydrolase
MPNRRVGPLAATVAGALVAASLVAAAGALPSANAQTPTTLRVMEFNVEYGGFHVSWDSTLDVIRRSDADVVAIEEGYGRVDALARDVPMPYYSERYQLLSRYPIADPPGSDGRYAFVEIAPGEVVAIQNVHLPSNPYGPFRILQGETRAQILTRERDLRVPAIEPILDASAPLIDDGIPVFLTGDFNAPSWRDWTSEMVRVRPQIEYPVRWPVSVAVERAGFVDSYREIHPDVLRDPGLTWPSSRPDVPGWDPGKNAPADRIDLIYAAGANATASEVFGSRGDDGVLTTVDPWPSDHRAVMSTFDVTPAPMPVLVWAARPVVPVGTDLAVSYHLDDPAPPWRVALVPAGGDALGDALATQPVPPNTVDGTLSFDTSSVETGSYEAVLLDGAGTERSRIAVWVKEPGAGPIIETGSPSYPVGQAIDVHWTNAPGNRWDWVGIYRRHRDPHVRYYLLWTYTGSSIEGTVAFDETAHGPWPLPAGRYSVYLLQDDGYRKLAAADFEVTG